MNERRDELTMFATLALLLTTELAWGWEIVCGNALDGVVGACPAAFRRGHSFAAATSESSLLYVFGGQTLASQVVGGDARPRNDLWSVDISSAEWAELQLDWRETTTNWTLDCSALSSAATVPAPRTAHVMAIVPGSIGSSSELVIAGGQCGNAVFDDLWIYKVRTGTWKRITEHTMQLAHTSGVVWDGTLYLFGGVNGSSGACSNKMIAVPLRGSNAGVASEIAGESMTDNWPQARMMHTATLYNDVMVVFGGNNGTTALNDLWVFDFATRRWSRIDSTLGDAWPAGRFGHAAALCDATTSGLGRAILAVQGGMRSTSQVFSDLYTFDFATRTWSFRTNEGRMRAFAGISCGSSHIWVFGGTDMQTGVFNDLVSYLLTS